MLEVKSAPLFETSIRMESAEDEGIAGVMQVSCAELSTVAFEVPNEPNLQTHWLLPAENPMPERESSEPPAVGPRVGSTEFTSK